MKERIEVTARRTRKRKQLLDGLRETREYKNLKEKTLYRTLWRTLFGRNNGPVLRQSADDDE